MATTQIEPIGRFKYTKDDNGNYHSYDDEPAIEYLDGTIKIWYRNGLIHRDNKPAIIRNNYDGKIIEEFYYNGIKPKNFSIPAILSTTFNISYNMSERELNKYLNSLFLEYRSNRIQNNFIEKFGLYVTKGEDSGCKFKFPNDYFISDEEGGDNLKKFLQIFGLEYNDFIIGNRYDDYFNGCENFIFRDELIKAIIQKCYT